MALTYSLPVNKKNKLPQFQLKTVLGEIFDSNETASSKVKVFAFICNHCPYVKAIESRIIQLAHDLQLLDIPFIGICSNDPTDYPEDHPDVLKETWLAKKYDFTYLIDDSQNVAKMMGAVCTPEFFCL